MLFKEMKPGNPVYLLKREDGLKAYKGKIVKVSDPYYPPVPAHPQGGYYPSNTTQRFVDVMVEAEGVTSTYMIPETLSVTFANSNSLIMLTDTEGILKEIDSIQQQNEEEQKNVDRRKKEIEDGDKIKEEWNPAFAEKREQDKRISGIESEVKGMKKMLSDFINEFKK